MKRLGQRSLTVLLSVAMASAPPKASAGTMTGAASEWTQIMNNIALLQQVIHQIRAVVQLVKQGQYWARNLKNIGSLEELESMVGQVGSLVSDTRGIILSAENIADNFRRQSGRGDDDSLLEQWEKTHPERVDPRSLPSAKGRDGKQVDKDALRRIDDSMQLAVKKSLAVLDIQVNEFDDDKKVFDKLKQRLSSMNEDDKNAGVVKCLQASNALQLEHLKQLMKLRQVLIVHANAMGEFQSAQAQRNQLRDTLHDRDKYTGRFRDQDTGDDGEPSRTQPSMPSVGGLGEESEEGEEDYADEGSAGGAPDDDSAGPEDASYVTPDGRTVIRAPGATSPGLESYTTPDGRTVFRTPDSASPELETYETSDGRTVTRPPGSNEPDLETYETADGRTVTRVPGATAPELDTYETRGGRTVTRAPGSSSPELETYETPDGRTVTRAPRGQP